MKDRKGIIYIITNDLNGKQYVGQTITTINERWAGHRCDSRRKNNAIANAINKYGDDNFTIIPIEENIPYEELDNKEIFYIKEYNTVAPNGYNLSYGGQAFRTEDEIAQMRERVLGEKNPMYGAHGELNPFYGKEHTDNSRHKMSKIQKEIWTNKTDDDKAKEINRLKEMSKEYYKNNKSGMFGKSHSDEVKEKISKTLTGREFSEEHKRKLSENSTKLRKVIMIDKDTNEELMEFNSMTIACEWLVDNTTFKKAKAGHISHACTNKVKTSYGYKWKYKE